MAILPNGRGALRDDKRTREAPEPKRDNANWATEMFTSLLRMANRMMALVAAIIGFCMSATGANPKSHMKASSRASPPVSGSKRSVARSSPPVSGSKPRKRSVASTKEDAQSEPVYVERDKPETPSEKRIRSLRKKLREIDVLQERAERTGEALDSAAAQKIASRPEIEAEVDSLKQIVALELKEAADKAASEAAAEHAKAEAAAAAAATRAEAKAAAEAALARKRRTALEVLANIDPRGEDARNDSRLQELLKQVSDLSMEVFGEDCLQKGVSKKSGWRLSLLARPIPEDPENTPPEGPNQLLGFLVFRFRPEHQCISIAKIAVPQEKRSKGFGKHLMEWVTKYAQQQGSLQHVSLSSLPEAVKFYQSFGFKAVQVDSLGADDEELVEGQVYMEYRLKPARAGGARQGPPSGRRKSV